MEVNFAPELQEKIERIAAEARRDAGEFVQEIVTNYLDEPWYREKVEASIAQMDRGEYLTHEEVGERLEKLYNSE
jgi:predicted transcriptional regulator